MLNYIKSKLKKWLNFEKIESELTSLKKENSELTYQVYLLKNKLSELEYINDRLIIHNDEIISQFNLSSDIYLRENSSWAVISIAGKPEYVKFINLQNKDMREIAVFLRKFERTNVTVDSPFKDDWRKY